ncbi:MAG: lysylphosphatidylglycerol synthase transmembrane domain-containing protein [Solirubrobacterales bacterium]
MDFLESTLHALRLIGERVVDVDPWWLLAGVVLFEVQQAVRTRGWFRILRAAYPDAAGLRARDVCAAYLAGAGMNSVLPARLGDVLKLWLVRRRVPDGKWSTLGGTFVPETLFDVIAGGVLVIWAFSAGLLPLPVTTTELPTIDVSLIGRHPLVAVAVAVGVVAGLGAWSLRRRRLGVLVARIRRGMAIMGQPRTYLTGVVPWQALARVIRFVALAAWMRAFDLPVTPASVLLVMAAQGGGRIIPLAPASAGLRLAMLSYGFAQVTRQPVDIAAITAFQVGVGAAQLMGSLVVGAGALAWALGSMSPAAAIEAIRQARRTHRIHRPPLASGALRRTTTPGVRPAGAGSDPRR